LILKSRLKTSATGLTTLTQIPPMSVCYDKTIDKILEDMTFKNPKLVEQYTSDEGRRAGGEKLEKHLHKQAAIMVRSFALVGASIPYLLTVPFVWYTAKEIV
jgi:hypothetical protein